MSDLPITYAGIDYLDRTRPLVDGSVQPKGASLRYITVDPGELFRRVAQGTEFEVAEMSTSTYMNQISRGDERYVAIPVFPSRNFRHGYIYVRGDSDIREPKDLVGSRVGVPEYQMTAAVWQRAALEHDYGVKPQDITWFQGGESEPVYVERNAIPNPPGVSIEIIPEGKTLQGMLDAGELDALFTPNRPPSLLDGSGRLRRLFENWVEVEQDYFKRTGFFPIMHLIVIRRDIYDANPWLPVSLLDAFAEAKRLGWDRLIRTGSLAIMAPWLPRELEEMTQVLGPDYWPYGFRENHKIVDAMCQYHFEQGLSDTRLTPEDLFVPETHNAPVGKKRYALYAS